MHSLQQSFCTLTGRTGGLLAIGLTIAMCLNLCHPAGAGKKENGLYTLRYKFKEGDVANYQTSGQFLIQFPSMGQASAGKDASKPVGQAAPMTLPLNASQKVKVLKALADGSGELEVTVLSSGASLEGSAPTPETATYTLSPTGSISGVKGRLGGGGSDMISAFSGAIVAGSISAYLPEKPVKPGETWTRKVPMAQAGSTGTVVGKFVSVGQTGHYKTAHLKLVITVPINTASKSATGNKTQSASGGKTLSANGDKTPGTQGTPPAISLSGKIVMTFEDDFAVAEGKLIKSAGTGTADLKLSPMPTGDKSGKPAALPTSISTKITLSSTLTQ